MKKILIGVLLSLCFTSKAVKSIVIVTPPASDIKLNLTVAGYHDFVRQTKIHHVLGSKKFKIEAELLIKIMAQQSRYYASNGSEKIATRCIIEHMGFSDSDKQRLLERLVIPHRSNRVANQPCYS